MPLTEKDIGFVIIGIIVLLFQAITITNIAIYEWKNRIDKDYLIPVIGGIMVWGFIICLSVILIKYYIK